MNRKDLQAAEGRLIEVNKIVEKLDPSIRAGAFDLLKVYVVGYALEGEHDHVDDRQSKSLSKDLGLAGLIQLHVHDKPSDNVHLLAAHWYGQYGLAPFATNTIKEYANSTGLTIPEHLTMTIRSSQDGGKKVYQSAGRGLYKPTVNGELFLKRTYGVTKGTGLAPLVADS